jgi:hypothetical protein
METADPMVGKNLFDDRPLLPTFGLRKFTPSTKTAARGRLNETGNLSRDVGDRSFWVRKTIQELPCIRVKRLGEKGGNRSNFHHLSCIHDDHSVANLTGYAEIVSNI